MLALVEFVRQREHRDIQLQVQEVAQFVEKIETPGILPAEPYRHDVALRHAALGDEGLFPGEVLHDAVNLAGAQAGGENDDLPVGIEGLVDLADQVRALAAHLVDGDGVFGDGLDRHQEVVGRHHDLALVFPADETDDTQCVDPAQRMVAGKGEAAFVRKIVQSFHLHVHVVVFQGFLGEFHPEVAFLQVAVEVVLVDESFEPVQDELGYFFLAEAALDNLVEVEQDGFVNGHGFPG